jgi:hypothetical protein
MCWVQYHCKKDHRQGQVVNPLASEESLRQQMLMKTLQNDHLLKIEAPTAEYRWQVLSCEKGVDGQSVTVTQSRRNCYITAYINLSLCPNAPLHR